MTHPTDAAIAQAFREYDEGDIVQLRMILARARELGAEKPEQVHTCSYYCDRPECLKAQRDELRDRLEGLDAEKGGEFPDTRIGVDTIAALYAKATPPAQAAEAVERVRCALWENRTGTYNDMAPSAHAQPDGVE